MDTREWEERRGQLVHTMTAYCMTCGNVQYLFEVHVARRGIAILQAQGWRKLKGQWHCADCMSRRNRA